MKQKRTYGLLSLTLNKKIKTNSKSLQTLLFYLKQKHCHFNQINKKKVSISQNVEKFANYLEIFQVREQSLLQSSSSVPIPYSYNLSYILFLLMKSFRCH